MSPQMFGGNAAGRRVTPLQRRILGWVGDFLAARGMSPTVLELRDALGISERKCRVHLLALERAGFIRRRTLEVATVPRGGLSAAEVAWCQANPGRVRAMMSISAEAGA